LGFIPEHPPRQGFSGRTDLASTRHARGTARRAVGGLTWPYDPSVEPPRDALTFAYDYGQLYLRNASHELAVEGNDYLDALDAANRAGLTVGTASGIVDVLMPRQENFFARLELSLAQAPPAESETADHVVEFDLVSSGRITLEGSGGSGELEFDLPPGRYRARLSGFEFDAAAEWSYRDPGNPADHYRLELWPVDEATPPTELKRWAGYADLL
jgi:hypothetical protein